jgi:hypothetical protein
VAQQRCLHAGVVQPARRQQRLEPLPLHVVESPTSTAEFKVLLLLELLQVMLLHNSV